VFAGVYAHAQLPALILCSGVTQRATGVTGTCEADGHKTPKQEKNSNQVTKCSTAPKTVKTTKTRLPKTGGVHPTKFVANTTVDGIAAL
jgi:hypothetical protein